METENDEAVVLNAEEKEKSCDNQPLFDDLNDVTFENETCFSFPLLEEAKEQAENLAKRIWEVTHFQRLPDWLQDNEFLHHGHRPQLPSFSACFASIFRLHSETGNIWSHMLGCIIFLFVAIYVLTKPEINWENKFVFLPFFVGAIACMFLSSAFHTLYCHSKEVGSLFLKLDYVGISLLIMGSFIPWLYYSFYCRSEPKIIYITLIVVLGLSWVFTLFALSGVIPACHYFITDGFWTAFKEASFGWLIIMALLYLCGTVLYAFRIPERFFPGKCDIWFQSHQLFHLFVVFAAFVNYHGINELANSRGTMDSCQEKFNQFFHHQHRHNFIEEF